MKDFQQSDKGGIAKSQLTTLLWFLWIWYASRKSSSNTRGEFANNFGRMEIKHVIIFPAMLSISRFVSFLILSFKFVFI